MSELKDYLRLSYTVILRRDHEGDFVAKVDELPGCSAHGKTPEEALANLEEAKSLWIADCLENGDAVPVPAEEGPLPSGKWLQRVPRKLHRKLQLLCKNEGVSFNQFVSSILAEAVGERVAAAAAQQNAHALNVQYCHPAEYFEYFGESGYEPLPAEFKVMDVTCSWAKKRPPADLIEGLAHLSAQLPDRIELRKKAAKDENKKHRSFEIC